MSHITQINKTLCAIRQFKNSNTFTEILQPAMKERESVLKDKWAK